MQLFNPKFQWMGKTRAKTEELTEDIRDIGHMNCMNYMRGSRKFCQSVSNFDIFFSLMRGGRIQIPLLAGHPRPASETPF